MFLYKHRRAPPKHSTMFAAVIALRGAQPIADRAPLVAVRMFNEFTKEVRKLSEITGCYTVCDIGDRCVFVVSQTPEPILKLAQCAILDISVQGYHATPVDVRSRTSHAPSATQRSTRSTSNVRAAPGATRTTLTTASHLSDDNTLSSFVGTATCHPSVACHTLTASGVYDADRDTYFYGTSAQLNKICEALDMAKSGEVCWTDQFDNKCDNLCREASSLALSAHTASENGEIVLHVASWWKESGDERDNEDPSTAMAVLSDSYVRRMTLLVSEGKSEFAKDRQQRKTLGETRSGSSDKSNEATCVTRTATMLHITLLKGAEKTSIETVRRIVSEEKGVVVSAHDATIVSAYNLLSPGGHHQIRAADTVMRLREALPNSPFAASIQHGKVNAFIMDGFVMCAGEAVELGKALLQEAVAFCENSKEQTETSRRVSVVGHSHGICLLCCHSELSSSYDCEAVNVSTFKNAGKPKVVYRLALRRAGKATDDEWMYRLKDDEDQSPFAVINSVFNRIANHDFDEAARLWRELGPSQTEVSAMATDSLARHLQSK